MQETLETLVGSLGQEDPLEEEMATHPSILAWEIPWTEEPGGLQSMGLQKSQIPLSNETITTRKKQSVWSLRWSLRWHQLCIPCSTDSQESGRDDQGHSAG